MNRKKFTRIRNVTAKQQAVVFEPYSEQDVVPYDENLLERSRINWRFGDWQSLSQLKFETLQHHPDRAKLVLLGAAGRLQMGLDAEAKQYLRIAKDWGISKKILSEILIAGVHNSLGRAALIDDRKISADYHFELAVCSSGSTSDIKNFINARKNTQQSEIKQKGAINPLENNNTNESIISNEGDTSFWVDISSCVSSLKYDSPRIWYRKVTNNQIKTESMELASGNFLATLCDNYGSDKGSMHLNKHPYPWPPHNYSAYYDLLFGDKRSEIRNLFECGIGTNNTNIKSNMSATGVPGASLRVWRDYFPNANIVGADIDPDILFEENRISTFMLDQTDRFSIRNFWKKIGYTQFDIIIDDGLHEFCAGITLFEESIKYLSPCGYYIIEDIIPDDIIKYTNYFRGKKYDFNMVLIDRSYCKPYDNNLIVIRNNNFV